MKSPCMVSRIDEAGGWQKTGNSFHLGEWWEYAAKHRANLRKILPYVPGSRRLPRFMPSAPARRCRWIGKPERRRVSWRPWDQHLSVYQHRQKPHQEVGEFALSKGIPLLGRSWKVAHSCNSCGIFWLVLFSSGVLGLKLTLKWCVRFTMNRWWETGLLLSEGHGFSTWLLPYRNPVVSWLSWSLWYGHPYDGNLYNLYNLNPGFCWTLVY